MQIFRRLPKKGTPLRDPSIWEGILRMARAWETLDVQNGHIDWSFGRPTIVVYSAGGGGGGGAFNGVAYRPDGTFEEKLDDPEQPWVRYKLSTNEITEEVGPPASPWGVDETWRKKSDFAGAIYF